MGKDIVIDKQRKRMQKMETKSAQMFEQCTQIKQNLHKMRSEHDDCKTSVKLQMHCHLDAMNAIKSSVHTKQNQLLCFDAMRRSNVKQIVQRQVDSFSNGMYCQWNAMNAKMEWLDNKMDSMTNALAQTAQTMEKRESAFVETINALQSDEVKDGSEDLSQFAKTTRTSPRRIDKHFDDEIGDEKEELNEQHIEKLEQLLNLTKNLLNETDEEKQIKKMLTN